MVQSSQLSELEADQTAGRESGDGSDSGSD